MAYYTLNRSGMYRVTYTGKPSNRHIDATKLAIADFRSLVQLMKRSQPVNDEFASPVILGEYEHDATDRDDPLAVEIMRAWHLDPTLYFAFMWEGNKEGRSIEREWWRLLRKSNTLALQGKHTNHSPNRPHLLTVALLGAILEDY